MRANIIRVTSPATRLADQHPTFPCPVCWMRHSRSARRRTDALQMLQQLGNPFIQVAFDPHSQAVMEWGVYGAPETFLIDADGIIRARHKGALTPALWQQRFAHHFTHQ